MLTTRKMIGSRSLSLLAACILPLCLAVPCAAASSTDLAAQGLAADPPDIIFPKPPAIPPPARVAVLAPCAAASSTDLAAQGLAADPPDIIFPKPPAIPPPASLWG